MRKTLALLVAGLLSAAFVSWTPAAQAVPVDRKACLVDPYDLDALGGTPVEVPSGSWVHFLSGQITRTPEIRAEFLDKSIDSVTLDGKALTYEYSYSDVSVEGGTDDGWDPPVTWESGTYPAVWIDLLLKPLKPGVHTLVHEWYVTEAWSDGWYPFTDGWDWGGTATIVVTPRDLYPSGHYESLCEPG